MTSQFYYLGYTLENSDSGIEVDVYKGIFQHDL